MQSPGLCRVRVSGVFGFRVYGVAVLNPRNAYERSQFSAQVVAFTGTGVLDNSMLDRALAVRNPVVV